MCPARRHIPWQADRQRGISRRPNSHVAGTAGSRNAAVRDDLQRFVSEQTGELFSVGVSRRLSMGSARPQRVVGWLTVFQLGLRRTGFVYSLSHGTLPIYRAHGKKLFCHGKKKHTVKFQHTANHGICHVPSRKRTANKGRGTLMPLYYSGNTLLFSFSKKNYYFYRRSNRVHMYIY